MPEPMFLLGRDRKRKKCTLTTKTTIWIKNRNVWHAVDPILHASHYKICILVKCTFLKKSAWWYDPGANAFSPLIPLCPWPWSYDVHRLRVHSSGRMIIPSSACCKFYARFQAAQTDRHCCLHTLHSNTSWFPIKRVPRFLLQAMGVLNHRTFLKILSH